jgi:hypothetical protein
MEEKDQEWQSSPEILGCSGFCPNLVFLMNPGLSWPVG